MYPPMISSKPLLNQIERWPSLNIKFVVKYLRQTTNNTILVEDDGYYASYTVPMVDKENGLNRQVNVLLDFSKLHFGGIRYWLVCEHCHKRVANLYPAAGNLACRHCIGLEYASRTYANKALFMPLIRYEKAAKLLATRRLVYAGKPTRAGRRLNRLVTPDEFAGIIGAAFGTRS